MVGLPAECSSPLWSPSAIVEQYYRARGQSVVKHLDGWPPSPFASRRRTVDDQKIDVRGKMLGNCGSVVPINRLYAKLLLHQRGDDHLDPFIQSQRLDCRIVSAA